MKVRALLPALAVALWAADAPPRMPIPNNYDDSTTARWLKKPVAESRMLDDAESLGTWKLVDVDQAKGEMTLAGDRKVSGANSLRLRCATTGAQPARGRYYGTSTARRVVSGEDWSAWNRVSAWIYPDLPGFRVVSMIWTFHNEGAEPVPDRYNKMGVNYVILKNHEWNHVVWEIANLTRDKVTGLDFSYRMQGHEPGAGDTATLYVDKLELQKVTADQYEGWNVAPGRISYSQSGYQVGSPKSAIASDLKAAQFELVNAATKQPVLTKKVANVETPIGRFQVLDFSEFRTPGRYFLRAGGRSTRPFPIGDDIWKSSLWKTINFFYAQRCGFAIPGVHDACHRDWVLRHGDKSLIVNGGWHDAGDLSQSLSNTAEAAYSMYSLAERMQARNEDPALLNRLLEEADWGLDWLLKVTFHDGFRPAFSQMDRWTDGIIGNLDDVSAQAGNNPASNLAAAATEALAARVLKRSDPIRAGYALKQAEEDWGFAMEGMARPGRGSEVELAGHAITAGLDLYQATGNRKYADKAIELSKTITDSQRRNFLPGLTTPLAGFFYTGPDKTRILRYQHLSHEEAAPVALVRLCELFPDDPRFMQWYSAVTLYTEYFQKPMARLSEPYGMLANSVFADDEYLRQPERGGQGATREDFRDQVLSGIKVGDHHYVRLFPVWFEFRGNNGTMMAENKAVSAAAHLRGSLELAGLAERNLQWIVGRNPFVESLMWGEGYDYAPQYTAMSGDIVGALPVGIQSHRNADAPYWPTENCHNWKEVWVHPVGRWIWLLRDLAGPGEVGGAAPGPVGIREVTSGRMSQALPDVKGNFHATLSAGEYELKAGARKRLLTVLAGETYAVDLSGDRALDMRLKNAAASPSGVTVRVELTGTGEHTVELRTDNLAVDQALRKITLKPGVPQIIEWNARREAADAPWIAVAIPDHRFADRKEITGK